MKKLLFALLFFPASAFAGGFMFFPPVAAVAAGGGGSCNAAGTAISFVASASQPSGTSTNRTISKPAGTTTDDVMVAGGEYESNTDPSSSITPPSGFTLFMSTVNTATSPDDWIVMYVKRATASEPASYTWTFASAWNGFGIGTFRNVNTGCGPFDSDVSSNTFSSTANYTGKSVTTQHANAELLLGQVNFDGNANNCPAGWAGEAFDISQSALCYTAQASAGATGSISGSISASSNGCIGVSSLVD